MAGAAHVTKLTNPSIMPRLWNGALSRMMLVSSGRETPVPSAMISRAASSIGKFNASAPTSVPTENSAMAITNNALVGNLRTMNGDVGMATESNSRYPVVSHCTTSAEIGKLFHQRRICDVQRSFRQNAEEGENGERHHHDGEFAFAHTLVVDCAALYAIGGGNRAVFGMFDGYV